MEEIIKNRIAELQKSLEIVNTNIESLTAKYNEIGQTLQKQQTEKFAVQHRIAELEEIAPKVKEDDNTE